MQKFEIQAVWVLIVVGVVLWLWGNSMYKKHKEEGKPSIISRFLGLVGVAAVVLGLYAGFRGPLQIGSITLKRFSFAPNVQKSNSEAYAYVCANLKISSSPASGWHGSSKTALAYTVKNAGSREVSVLHLSFKAETGPACQIALHGPFPAGKTVTKVATVPSTVQRSYFQDNLAVGFDHVIGASF